MKCRNSQLNFKKKAENKKKIEIKYVDFGLGKMEQSSESGEVYTVQIKAEKHANIKFWEMFTLMCVYDEN